MYLVDEFISMTQRTYSWVTVSKIFSKITIKMTWIRLLSAVMAVSGQLEVV